MEVGVIDCILIGTIIIPGFFFLNATFMDLLQMGNSKMFFYPYFNNWLTNMPVNVLKMPQERSALIASFIELLSVFRSFEIKDKYTNN